MKSPFAIVGLTLLLAIIVFSSLPLLVKLRNEHNTNVEKLESSQMQKSTELCEVVEHEQIIRSPHGNIRISVLKRPSGKLQEIYLDNIAGFTCPPIGSIPAEVRYVFATGLTDSGISPTSLVLVYPR